MKKILIIRFSSIGDIIQCMSVVDYIKAQYPNAQIHWIARKDMSEFLHMDTRINKVWGFDKKLGFSGLIDIIKELKKENFDFVYDAHSNIRSNIIKAKLCPWWKRILGIGPKLTLRSKERIKRILLFNFKIDLFPMPFKGIHSFVKPLKKIGVDINTNPTKFKSWVFPKELISKIDQTIFENNKIDIQKTITIVPSAAWEMKRWPVEHWKKLVELMPNYNFIILAGPADTFCKEIENVDTNRVYNLAGKTSLFESCYIVKKSSVVVSADTGFLHAADMFGIKGISIVGPTAFGYTTGKHIKTLETNLKCRPCTKDGRGKCKQKVYKKCLVDITPELVKNQIENLK